MTDTNEDAERAGFEEIGDRFQEEIDHCRKIFVKTQAKIDTLEAERDAGTISEYLFKERLQDLEETLKEIRELMLTLGGIKKKAKRWGRGEE